ANAQWLRRARPFAGGRQLRCNERWVTADSPGAPSGNERESHQARLCPYAQCRGYCELPRTRAGFAILFHNAKSPRPIVLSQPGRWPCCSAALDGPVLFLRPFGNEEAPSRFRPSGKEQWQDCYEPPGYLVEFVVPFQPVKSLHRCGLFERAHRKAAYERCRYC